MSILNAFSGVSTVFLMGLLGFLLARKGWIGKETAAAMPRFITVVALPPYLLRTATTTINHDQLIELFMGAGVPFLSILLAFGAGLALSFALAVAPARKGPFCTGIATSNAMNIGLPINITLFGEAALPYALIYLFANSVFFWTVGCYNIARSGSGHDVSFLSSDTLKRIFSPPLIGFGIGLLLVYFEIRLPDFIDRTFKYVGDMVIALGTMYVGVMVSTINRSEFHFDRETFTVFAGRFILSPLLVLFLTWLMPVPPMMRNVFIIQSSLPVMINVAILSAYYKADARYAAMLTGCSTFLSILTIPVYMTLMTVFSS